MNSTYYFPHDYSARNCIKALALRAEYGWEGYGIYLALLETLCENEGKINTSHLAGISLGLGVEQAMLKQIIDCCIGVNLLYEEEEFIRSEKIDDHFDKRQALSKAGLKGAKAKLKGGSSYERKGKERKREEIKGKEIEKEKEKKDTPAKPDPMKTELQSVIDHLNQISGKHFTLSETAEKNMRKLYDNGKGYTIQQMKEACDKQVSECMGKKEEVYVHPKTIFRNTDNFERILNKPITPDRGIDAKGVYREKRAPEDYAF